MSLKVMNQILLGKTGKSKNKTPDTETKPAHKKKRDRKLEEKLEEKAKLESEKAPRAKSVKINANESSNK